MCSHACWYVFFLCSLQAAESSLSSISGGGAGQVLPRDEDVPVHPSALQRRGRPHVSGTDDIPTDD